MWELLIKHGNFLVGVDYTHGLQKITAQSISRQMINPEKNIPKEFPDFSQKFFAHIFIIKPERREDNQVICRIVNHTERSDTRVFSWLNKKGHIDVP